MKDEAKPLLCAKCGAPAHPPLWHRTCGHVFADLLDAPQHPVWRDLLDWHGKT